MKRPLYLATILLAALILFLPENTSLAAQRTSSNDPETALQILLGRTSATGEIPNVQCDKPKDGYIICVCHRVCEGFAAACEAFGGTPLDTTGCQIDVPPATS